MADEYIRTYDRRGYGAMTYNFPSITGMASMEAFDGATKVVKAPIVKAAAAIDTSVREKGLAELLRLQKNHSKKRLITAALEEYITILYGKFHNSKLLGLYNEFYRVGITHHETGQNYISFSLDIAYYQSEEHYNKDISHTNLSINIDELFSNCSSVCFSRMGPNRLLRTANSSNPDETANFTKSFLDMCIHIVRDIYNYSYVLYTESDENSTPLRNYLEANFTVLNEFNNKRTNNRVRYFGKAI